MGTCTSAPRDSDGDSDRPRISVRQPGERASGPTRYPACKIVLLGNSAAGKTSLVQRFTRDAFQVDGCATIGAAFTSHVVDLSDGRSLQLDIWDTAGQERYRTLAPLYYRNASAAVIVFDVTDRDSFEGCQAWAHDFQEQRPGESVVLVGNKMDLDSQREVSQEEAQVFAKTKSMQYIETSAKLNQCVSTLFELVAASILDKISENQ